MNDKQLGEPVLQETPTTDGAVGKQPTKIEGLDWVISEKTRREIEELEANIRAAEQLSGRLLMD